MRSTLPALAALGAAVVVSVLTGCSSEAESQTTAASATVIEPGRPGEPATTYAPGEQVPLPQQPGVAEADVAFIAGMIPHHEQALVMADLAPQRAQDSRVRGLAARISDVQQAEIAVYRAWLAEQGLGPDGRPAEHRGDAGHDGHGGDGAHAGMAGMASEAELQRLRAASGEDFDRLWLELMTRHHEGALQMVDQRDRAGGTDQRIGELAAGVGVEQSAEIERMQEVLASLG